MDLTIQCKLITCTIVFLFEVWIVLCGARSETECRIESRNCTYRAVLSESCGNSEQSHPSETKYLTEKLARMEDIMLQLRNDYSKKISTFERKLYVKSDTGSGSNGGLQLKDEPGRTENVLLNRLHKEFTALRLDLAQTKKKLRETEKLLSKTQIGLNETRAELDGTTRKLTIAENRLQEATIEGGKARAELEVCRNELNRTQFELEETAKKYKRCQLESSELQSQNKNLTAELENERNKLEETRRHLARTLQKYHELNLRHENTTGQLKLSRHRLVDYIKGQIAPHCEFEDSRICGFSQDNETDNLDWFRSKGSDPVAGPGPKTDHTCSSGRGHYMYVEAKTRLSGQVARLRSRRIIGLTEQCVEFYYYILGRYVGTLNVYTEVPDQEIVQDIVVPKWRIYGNQGDVWILAKLSIPSDVAQIGYRVVFEGIIDRGINGDIAIDDFKITEGSCDGHHEEATNVSVKNETAGAAH